MFSARFINSEVNLPGGNLLLLGDRFIYFVSKNDSLIDVVENKHALDSILVDCTGRIYFKNTHSIYPVAIKNGPKILLSETSQPSATILKPILETCACNKEMRIKEWVSHYNQQILYVIETVQQPKRIYDFYLVCDTKSIETAAAVKNELDTEYVPERMGDINWKLNKVVKRHMRKTWQFDFFITKKTYSPLYIFRDTIFVFDHAAKKLISFRYSLSDTLLELFTAYTDSIIYTEKKGWQNQIVLDACTGKFFVLYKNEALSLTAIRTKNRQSQESFTLPKKHIFAEKLKVYNHRVYYLCRDKSNALANKMLYWWGE